MNDKISAIFAGRVIKPLVTFAVNFHSTWLCEDNNWTTELIKMKNLRAGR